MARIQFIRRLDLSVFEYVGWSFLYNGLPIRLLYEPFERRFAARFDDLSLNEAEPSSEVIEEMRAQLPPEEIAFALARSITA